MRILLVRPPRIKQAITLGEFMFAEPIGLECIYEVLKKQYEVRILDLMCEKEDFAQAFQRWQPDVVGITSLCIDVHNVREIARQVRRLNSSVVTVVGGTQAYFKPEAFFCKEIDHVMQYTTKENLITLFECLSTKKSVPLIDGIRSQSNEYHSTGKPGRNEYMIPDRTSTEQYRQYYSYFGYKPCAIMQTSLGCSKTCNFCLRWRLEGAKEKDQSLECIIEQIKDIKESHIMIFDNDFLHDGQRLEDFCDLLEQYQIHKTFMCYGSVKSILENAAAVKRFAQYGLKAVLVGYESFSQEELTKYEKKSTIEDNRKASKLLKEWKVDSWASFMIHPDWGKEDFKKFRRYLKVLQPEISSLSPLTPFPNLPMYEVYKDRLLYSPEEYERWSFGEVIIRPSKMGLQQYYYEILKTILYVNLYMNRLPYMVQKFGLKTVIRITKGSMKVFGTYIRLMLGA